MLLSIQIQEFIPYPPIVAPDGESLSAGCQTFRHLRNVTREGCSSIQDFENKRDTMETMPGIGEPESACCQTGLQIGANHCWIIRRDFEINKKIFSSQMIGLEYDMRILINCVLKWHTVC
jgi:hypothetical protein